MTWIIAGLGNPGEEFTNTRHNTGRMALEFFAKQHKFGEWKEDKKAKAHIDRGVIGKTLAVLVNPDTFMNKSGGAVGKFIKSQKAAERLVVVYDDLDLPFGKIKLSFDRGSGGHKGIESIIRTVKTKKFVRIRIGVSPSTASGAVRKPEGEKVVVNFILARFKPNETEELKKIFKRVSDAIETIVLEGREAAMNRFN
ncbi:MAG TPA: aminoacyl-tRNA hydrolase [Candidatus Paceibacterota bacterium]|jgi:PTH1 family peptidyl-tRNA hydrolase|nr:aminoacyl-tRNA hydrolase [Candidatus Paceibacterota bacterium]